MHSIGAPKFLSRILITYLCISTMVALFSLSAFGQESPIDLTQASLQDLMNYRIASASKFDQPISEAPSSVSIINVDEIKKYGYRTLADILRSVRGFNVTYDRDYSYLGVRGFGRPADYNTRILLMIDGHRVNDNIYDQGYAGTEFTLDVDLISRVEIIRGPGSSLYGNNAFFGVVNVITRKGADLHGLEGSAEAGSFDTYKGRTSYGNRFKNGLELLISATGFDSKGQSLYFKQFDPAFSSDPRASNNGVANHTDYDRSRNFFATVSLHDFTLTGAYSSRTKGMPTGVYGIDFNNPGNKTTDTRGYADLKYEHAFSNQTTVSAKVYFDYYAYVGDYLYAGVINRDKAFGEWWGTEVKFSTRLLDAHRLTAGLEYTDNLRQDQENYNVEPYALILDDKRRSTIWAMYAQDEYTILKNLLLNAGVRYDHYSNFGGSLNPRVGLIYTPIEKSTIKLLYGSAFRAPNAYEMLIANPNLKPETIQTYELVYEQYLGPHVRTSLTGYYYRIKDLISLIDDGSGSSAYSNVESAEAKGLEFEVEGKWKNGFEGRISYALQKAENNATGAVLSNSPQHMVKVNIVVPLWPDKIFCGLEGQYVGKRKAASGDDTSDFFITNLTVYSRPLLPGLELSGSVYNLFDRRYVDPVSIDFAPITAAQQDGRTFRVKLTYAF